MQATIDVLTKPKNLNEMPELKKNHKLCGKIHDVIQKCSRKRKQ